MAAIKAVVNGTKVWTGKCRASYVFVKEPMDFGGNGNAAYSMCLLIPKSDVGTVKAIKQAIDNAYAKDKDRFNGRKIKDLYSTLRDGDTEKDQDEYKGHYFINARNKNRKPGIVGADRMPLSDDELYSGCYVRATLTFYGYNVSGNLGIACSLGNIQKIADGDPLDGSSSAESDFEAIEEEEENYDFLS